MKATDLILIGAALAGAVWLAKKYRVSDFYGTRPLSQQSAMLEDQDRGFMPAIWSPDTGDAGAAGPIVSGGVWV